MGVAALLAELETISRQRADRVLRLRGHLPVEGCAAGGSEPFEVLIFRGFSSSVSHPTAFDPDQPALPEAAQLDSGELLQGPLNPAAERRMAGPAAVQHFLDPGAWL